MKVALILTLGFGAGFALGKIDINTVVQHSKDAYLNRYLVMSESRRQHITYYVYSKNAESMRITAESAPGVVTVNETGPDHLYEVVIEYTKRKEVVNALKAIPDVSAVFTVPLMCH